MSDQESSKISFRKIQESWAKYPETLDFNRLAKVSRYLIEQAYEVELIREEDEDLLYLGPELNDRFLATRFSQSESLTAEKINFEKEDQERDELDQIISTILMMGVEQGIRISEMWRDQKNLDSLIEQVIDSLREVEGNFDVQIQLLETVLDQMGIDHEIDIDYDELEERFDEFDKDELKYDTS